MSGPAWLEKYLMKMVGKTHVCFPNRSSTQSGTALLAVPDIPRLTIYVVAGSPRFRAEVVSNLLRNILLPQKMFRLENSRGVVSISQVRIFSPPRVNQGSGSV